MAVLLHFDEVERQSSIVHAGLFVFGQSIGP
jgi:hypothetical protein